MTSRLALRLLLPLALAFVSVGSKPAGAQQRSPNPVLYLTSIEVFKQDGKQFVRYRYDVANKEAYPASMFAEAPTLPPCGQNAKASRTWVDFFDQSGKRVKGFCALKTPADLGSIWIAFAEDQIPPSWVYIEMLDRQTNTKYKSNLADTVQ